MDAIQKMAETLEEHGLMPKDRRVYAIVELVNAMLIHPEFLESESARWW